MDNVMHSKKISAIVNNEKKLENIIDKLTQTTVGRHAISIQGSPGDVAVQCGLDELDAEKIQACKNPPTKEPFLSDDWGWVLGFSFALPLVICLILGIFIIGDIQSTRDNYLFGALGALVGVVLGALLASFVKKIHDNRIKAQEIKGGYVLWITLTGDEDPQEITKILKKCKATSIRLEDL